MSKDNRTTVVWKRIRILNNLEYPSRTIDDKLIEDFQNALAPPQMPEEMKLLPPDNDDLDEKLIFVRIIYSDNNY